MSRKLLLADDSITIQKVMGITFAKGDYELVIVDNGSDAVSKAKEIKPDLVLADVVMPEKDGYQVCRELKSDPSLSGVPVILLVGAFENFDEAKGKEAGADDYIIKPFESQTLIDKVNSILDAAVSAEPAAASASVSAIDASDEVVDLGEDEILEMPAEEEVLDSLEIEETPVSTAVSAGEESVEEVWSVDEFEEEAPEISDVKAAEEVPASEDDIWADMDLGDEPAETPAETEAETAEDEFGDFGFDDEEVELVTEETEDSAQEAEAISDVEQLMEEVDELEPEGLEEVVDEVEELHPEEMEELLDEVEEFETDSSIGEIEELETLELETEGEVVEEIEELQHDEIDEGAIEELESLDLEAPADDIVEELEEVEEIQTEEVLEFDDELDTSSIEEVEEIAEPLADEIDELGSFMLAEDTQDEADVEPLEENVVPPVTETEPESLQSPATAEPEDISSAVSAIPQETIEAIVAKVAREIIERVAWEVVPELAETMIKEEIKKLKSGG